MREIVHTVRRWRDDEVTGAVVRPIEESGIGTRRADAALAISAKGERAGGLYGGAADEAISATAREVIAEGTPRLLDIELSNSEAVRAGLACGGRARLLLQPIVDLPAAWWEAIERPQGAALVTPLAPDLGPSTAITPDGAAHPGAKDADIPADALNLARRRLAKNRGSREIVEIAGANYLLETGGAAPYLVVVGGGDLAAALTRQAALLNWEAESVETASEATERYAANTCLIVLSHDPAIDTPALSAALAAGIPYVGALGARHTQASRAERLRADGVSDEAIATIRGPVGLDLGARNPEETALAVCAEILGVLSGRQAVPLRDTTGAINA
ncbi:XdhC family protein [Thermopolyspora sp. NPDC052614]|uniref:XdhC family protein n=1 Tax=Thermopolyspora sp. NPDC052614 TaxID=3155682 RepID=UPI00343AEE31